MGNIQSLDSNDSLVTSLIYRNCIQTLDAEKVFRSVDRGLYFTDDQKQFAYSDSPWQWDKIHLSSPYIYATVLESLNLKPGNKFLNIGSGIGYFSTLAGLLLGVTGINHGIEIDQSLVDRAHQKLEEFKLNSAAIDYYHFCEPIFIQGNVCAMSTIDFYDRVYCGTSVPIEKTKFLMSLIKVGGILIMPFINGSLMRVTRQDKYTWKCKCMTIDESLKSFGSLVIPENFCGVNEIKFPLVEPLSLKELCRYTIRSSLRKSLENYVLPMSTKLRSSDNVFLIENRMKIWVRLENSQEDIIRELAFLLKSLNDHNFLIDSDDAFVDF